MRISIRTASRNRRSRRGAAAVELAAVFLSLMPLVAGCIDYGRIMYTYIAVTNATRAGAGAGIMSDYPATSAGLTDWQKMICTAVANEMELSTTFTASGTGDQTVYTNSQGLSVTAARITTGETGGLWRAQVTAQYPFSTLITWPAWVGIPSTTQLKSKVVLRVIR